ncbi:MAG: DUF554 family protein [Slackia sp.]
MVILGSLVNGLATVLMACSVCCLRKMPDSLGDFLMKGLGLCVILVRARHGRAVISWLRCSIVVGGLIGFAIDIDGWIHRFAIGCRKDRPCVSRVYRTR